MRRILLLCLSLLGFFVGGAEAQTVEPPKRWDVAGTAALFNVAPAERSAYNDEWYLQGRYAAAIGYYWTEHLKTELEFATSGEGRTFFQEYRQPVRLDASLREPSPSGLTPAGQIGYPYSVEAFHRLEQASARMVYQFGDNTWVHPYVSAGLVGDRDRLRVHVPPQFQYSSSRPVLVVPEVNQGPTYEYRLGYSLGGGVKLYMTTNSFFTTGVNFTHSRPASTFSWLAGFGFDF